MHNPRPCVIGFEANRDVVRCGGSGVHDVASDRVIVVVLRAAGTPNYRESMSVKVDGMLENGKLY